MKTKTVVEICCGIGGARKAFFDAGFEIVQSIDIDETISKFHKAFWGDCINSDITQCSFSEIVPATVLSAGFPCQPFSTSGYRTGFDHQQGNVFSSLMQLVDRFNYQCVFLENVQGLLSNDKNKTFKIVLEQLAKRFRCVEWITINLKSIGIPMNRPRVIIVAHNMKTEVLADLRQKFYVAETPSLFPEEKKWDFEKISEDTSANQLTGKIVDQMYILEKYSYKDQKFNGDLMEFIFGSHIGNFKIYSGRFWGRTGKTTFYTSENQFSHSVGTSMGGAPTFGFDPAFLNDNVLNAIKEVSNYQTEHSGYFVFRTTPEETLKFFGPKAEIFYSDLADFDAPMIAKYKMLGNMFAPDQAFLVTSALIKSLSIEG